MSDYKFSCPSCGQHLAGDERYAGSQIACPKCQAPITVPPPPGAPASPPPPAPGSPTGSPTEVAKAKTAEPPPPGPSPSPSPPLYATGAPPSTPRRPAPTAAPTTPKTCGLALASVICSAVGFVLCSVFGFIPGIVCGHMASSKLKRDPSLSGKGLATAGLIVGYCGLAVHMVAFGLFIASMFLRPSQADVRFGNRPVEVQRAQPARPQMTEAVDMTPDGSGWTMELEGVEIPSQPVEGRIHGEPFAMEKIKLQGGWLHFSQGKDFFADLEFSVVLFESNPDRLAGRSFVVPAPDRRGTTPHIWLKWKEPGTNARNQKSWTSKYAMRLEFDQIENGKLPGRIYLCVPDPEKSFIRGTFELDVKR